MRKICQKRVFSDPYSDVFHAVITPSTNCSKLMKKAQGPFVCRHSWRISTVKLEHFLRPVCIDHPKKLDSIMHSMTVSKKFALFAWWDSKKENQIPGNNQFM